MGRISDISAFSVKNSAICSDGKKIGKWWGKTLYSINKDGSLEYKHFSFIGLFLHYCFRCNKEFNTHALKDWLLAKNISPQLHPKDKKVTKNAVLQAFKTFQTQKQEFLTLCRNEQTLDQEIIKLFENKLLDINATLDNNSSPLQSACSLERFEVAKYLIRQGADANNLAPSLHHALKGGNEEVSLLLIEKGADLNSKNSEGESVLHRALKQKSMNVIKKILSENRGLKVNEFDKDGRTPLFYACEVGELEIIQLLLDQGADINAYNRCGLPPLFAAITHGDVDIVNLLIAKGADIRPKPIDKELEGIWETPMRIALGTRGWTKGELHCKVNQPMIELLHKHGADLNQAGELGRTPLHVAVSISDYATVKLLVKLGADPFVKDHEGKTPLNLAQTLGKRDEIIRFLQDSYRESYLENL